MPILIKIDFLKLKKEFNQNEFLQLEKNTSVLKKL